MRFTEKLFIVNISNLQLTAAFTSNKVSDLNLLNSTAMQRTQLIQYGKHFLLIG